MGNICNYFENKKDKISRAGWSVGISKGRVRGLKYKDAILNKPCE